jgi:hypothetical protein
VDDRIVITTSLRANFSLAGLRIENLKDFGTLACLRLQNFIRREST